MRKSIFVSLFLLATTLAFTFILVGCNSKRTPNLERIFSTSRQNNNKRPIIFVPGLIGSELLNSKTGKRVWPALLRSDDDIDLPIRPDFQNSRDNLVAGKVIRKYENPIIPDVKIFQELFDALEKYGGYKEGDWNNPSLDGDRNTYYLFGYDWRRDLVEASRLLLRNLSSLKQKLNRPDLRFNIVTMSAGGVVTRYAAMYGDADLPNDDEKPNVTWSGAEHINNIIMIGAPNEGTADMFAVLSLGYSITAGLKRRVRLLNKLSKEDALTSPAVFEILPFGESMTFLNSDLQEIKIDIYDIENWRKYGWSSAFDKKYRRGFEKKQKRPLADLDAYIEAVLKRTKKYHEALSVRTENPPVSLLAFGGDCEETLKSPVILFDEKKRSWQMLVRPKEVRASDGRKFSKSEVIKKMYAPGDRRVTRASMLSETDNLQERVSTIWASKIPFRYVFFVCGIHGYLHTNKFVLDNGLSILFNEAMN